MAFIRQHYRSLPNAKSVDEPSAQKIKSELDGLLTKLLIQKNDEFLPGEEYIKKWGYTVNKWGTVEYTP